ncbi:MAG: tripartite tricarboxylate transporter substrate binding protein [Betaproteobacteria bacterium]|nr:MAG: tripartite tricarboxylate transporter substrate binding protein [Betaproteobacteria bacterium]
MQATVLLALMAGATAISAHAQTSATAGSYPNRPIRIIVPFSAGSASDFLARQLAEKMTEHWGQQVVVDNRPSAGGIVAGEIVTRATPDGHTLMVTSSGIAGSAALYPKLPYDTAKDFASVSMVAIGSNMFVAPPNAGIKTMKDLIEIAKKKPGQLTYGHSGIGSGTHYASEYFNDAASIKTVHVPYKGAPAVLADTATGRLNYGVVPIAAAISMVKSGRVVAVAVTTSKRNHALPDVPTIGESGLPGFAYEGWFGMFAPGKLPPELIGKLTAEVKRILNLPDVRERIMNQAMIPNPTDPQTLHKLLTTEIETRKRIFKDMSAPSR